MTEDKVLDLILQIAKEDERIRAVVMGGSRANKDCPPDIYQDFDIVFFVKDVKPFWDNMNWINEKFGQPSLIQTPETMSLIPPDNNGNFVYLMIFPEGYRIDLCITSGPFKNNGEPEILLLDKDNIIPEIKIRDDYWYIKKPEQKSFHDCCNEFHWCLNNVAKGIARRELSYAMYQFNVCVRDMLIIMLDWYIGSQHNFQISSGKNGKYFKNLLPKNLYKKFCKTYSDANYRHMWKATFTALELFGEVARAAADTLDFTYDESEENGIKNYMKQVRDGKLIFQK